MEEDMKRCEKSVVDQIAWATDGQKNMERNDSLLSTPSKLNRPAFPMGFPPKTIQLRPSLLNVGSSYFIWPNQRMGVLGTLLERLSKYDKQPLQTNLEDDIPDTLCGNTPTIGIIKVISPNGKRVSTPHANSLGSLPGQWSGGRKSDLAIFPFPCSTRLGINSPYEYL